MPSGFTESELIAAPDGLVLLLELEFAGATWRFASRPVDIDDDATDQTYHYAGGLDEIQLVDDMALLSDAPAVRSIPIHLRWPDEDGVAPLIAAGHDLAAATGTLSLWIDGDDYADRVVVLRGYLADPTYGEPGEPVSFSLAENPWDDAGTLLDDQAVVKAGVTWSGPPDDVEGVPYPFPFGQPGAYTLEDGTAKNASGSPAIYVGQEGGPEVYLLIADRETEAGDTGATVQVYSTEYDEWQPLTASHRSDVQGRRITVVDATTYTGRVTDLDGDGVSDPWHDDDSFWVSWTGAGGAFRIDAREAIVGAGDLILAVLARSSVRVDLGACIGARAYLNRFKVAGYADIQGPPFSWIKDNLGFLPISWTASADGIYPAVFRWDAAPEMAVCELTEGPEYGLVRTSPVLFEGRDRVANEVTISYALRARTGDYHRTRTITGDPTKAGLPDTWSTAQARQSFSRHGQRAATLQSKVIYDTSSADLALETYVLARWTAHRVVRFDGDRRWGWLRKGDDVLVSIPKLSIAGKMGFVRSIARGLTGPSLELVLRDDPITQP